MRAPTQSFSPNHGAHVTSLPLRLLYLSKPMHKCLRFAKRTYIAALERRYNIHTGYDKQNYLPGNAAASPYEPTDYLLLKKCIRRLNLLPCDVVFDVGCGMGRVLCFVARMNVAKCIGIELSPELASVAVKNAQRLRGKRCPIEVRVADAATADYSEGTVFWLFNPFGPSVIEAMLQQIKSSLARSPREIRIAYLAPFHNEVMKKQNWLACFGCESVWYKNTEVTYWRSVG
jgi:SAM-dependent methyltransferase